jgi:hypothetical protein
MAIHQSSDGRSIHDPDHSRRTSDQGLGTNLPSVTEEEWGFFLEDFQLVIFRHEVED